MATTLVMLPDRSAIEIDEDVAEAMHRIRTAKCSTEDVGFARLTRTSDGNVIFVAVDKILFVEPE
jgi:hypothetical protein